MLSTLLATKLHRPRPTASLVARPRLTECLDAGLRTGHRLFLVVAPAGYGKTTLVADWLGQIDIPSAWLSLDEADNDPLRFFTYVVAALQNTAGPPLARPLLDAFPMTPQSPEAFVTPLINDLAALDRPIILALDDYHVIASAAVQEAMVFLLEHAPPNLHLVVLTRADPPFPLPRLRVRERMTEIRDRDLRFTPEEAAAFLNFLHHLDLPDEQIAALESRTEGWAAGVQLAALSLHGCSAERAAQFISAFSGSHHYIVDYLFEEVLSRQPDVVRAFLLQTSILERMCAPLCDAILGREATGPGSPGEARDPGDPLHPRPPAQEILEYLEHANLFLVPLDDERRWYRYHHLFVDMLAGMLQSASPPEHIAGLHDRAGEWYGQNGFVADAYRHALLAGNHARAAGILEQNAWTMVLNAELGTLKRWLEALPADELAQHPWLRINYAWALLFGDSEAAEAQLRAAEQQLQAGGTAVLPAQMHGHITALRTWIAYMRGDAGRAVDLAGQALALYPPLDAAVRSGLLAFAAVGCEMQHDWTGAARTYAEAADLAQASGNIMLEVTARTSVGQMSELLGRLHEAEAIFQEALETALLKKSPAAAQAYIWLARVYRQWDDLASARLFAEKALESSRLWAIADTPTVAHLFLATIFQAQNKLPEADRALAEASRAVREHHLEMPSLPWIGATRARLWLAQGKPDDARRWVETRGLSAEGDLDLASQVEYLTLVRILLAEGRPDAALRLALRLQSVIEATGAYGHLIEVLVLRAVALDRQGDTPSALAALERALSLAQPEGYMRVFLDEGLPIETLLRIGITKWDNAGLAAYARELLAACHSTEAGRPAPPAPAVSPGPLVESLSERELEVLRLVAAGWTNQEIAVKLVISVRTVKKHVENIHGKLGVRSRTQAAARARELNLL